MQVMKVDELIPHKMNSYFFDDIEGEPWMAFLDSIRTSGVIEPIIATQDKVIVSGHQRIRACKKLGIKEVAVEIRRYESEDEILKQLIETNIRQRGIGNTNAVKLGRCIVELERIYGIKNGNNQHTERVGHNVQGSKTQDDLAKELEMSKKQMSRFKSLTDLIPELQDAVQSGQITATTAMGFVKKLSPEEQKQLAEQIGGQDKVSGSEVQKYIDEIKAAKEENTKLRTALSEQGARNAELQHKLNNREVEVREVEVVPDDYEDLKKKAKSADTWKKDYEKQQIKTGEKQRQILELQQKIKDLQEQTVREQSNNDMIASAIMFATQCKNFIESVGGYVFLSERLMELPERERKGYQISAQAVHDWAQVVLNNIERSNYELLGSSGESN